MAQPGTTYPLSLRLWPGLIGGVLLIFSVLRPLFTSDGGLGVLAGVLGALIVVIWWLFFSRAPWSMRLTTSGTIAVLMYLTYRAIDASIAGGMMGLMFPISAIQTVALALVIWAVVSRGWSKTPSRLALLLAILIGCGVWLLLRTDGIISGGPQLAWRWTPTAEQKLLAQANDVPEPIAPAPIAAAPTVSAPPVVSTPSTTAAASPAAAATAPSTTTPTPPPAVMPPAEWPGFRGPDRDGVVRNLRINADWTAAPPQELWRRKVGPGWSSFAVQGDLIYTQEQRGDDEIVACYRLTTGKPVWMHRDKVRFWESNGGAGPRATPTLANGRVYAMGATGVLNALDARTGAVSWSRNAAADTGAKLPGWGFAGSPLVVDDLVVVATSGKLGAFDVATGKPRWIGPAGLSGYSSPQLMTIAGTRQIVLLNGGGATSVSPADGKTLWQHAWENGGAVIVQPVKLDDDVLINGIAMTGGSGVRRLKVTHDSSGWTATERWTSAGLKPYFNDFVVHNGHAYGFDGSILACIDLADGKRKWKGGRYGEGQLVALADSDLLLVLSEDGEIALVSATPDKFTELARIPAIEGKTWNHPVVVGDVLLIRNGEEMAAFRLPRASSGTDRRDE
ncbi:MAG TPA: PQQ-binding-like beta-propeller repeat protein [Vicinamibacterales bacterium]|nr:PQQ-binding-like beta-propeller repeat protein [Vicinamibacterales bacterium]